jgi:hypothetical protein
MNRPPFPASESSLGLKVLPFTGLKVYQKYHRWEGDICISQRENGLRTAGADPCRIQFSETLALSATFRRAFTEDGLTPKLLSFENIVCQRPFCMTDAG